MRAVALVALAAGCAGSPSGGGADLGGFAASVAGPACVTATACGISFQDVSSCTRLVAGVEQPDVAANAAVDAPEVRCLAGAGADCLAALRCLHGGAPCQIGSATKCAGSQIQSCAVVGTMGLTAGFDCASAGLACLTSGTRVGCGVRSCSGSGGAQASCSGQELTTCDGQFLHQVDCAAVGAACVAGTTAQCRGTGPVCSTTMLDPGAPLRCDGSVLVRCYDGQEARFDCASVGEGCFASATGFTCALGEACDPTAYTSTCDGNKLNYCDNGLLAAVDCLAAGFTTCDAFNGRCTR